MLPCLSQLPHMLPNDVGESGGKSVLRPGAFHHRPKAVYISGVLVRWGLVSTVRSLMCLRCAACSV